MHSFFRAVILAATLFCSLVVNTSARSPLQASQSKEPTGSISGRVTLGDNSAPGVTVLLTSPDFGPIEKPLPKTTTDEDGHFQLTHVPAGSYLLQTFTPAFVGPSDDMRGRAGKVINLSEGEAVEDFDIALTKGGVITGKVIDGNGQPLIQETVRLTALGEGGQKRGVNLPFPFMLTTDDRGVYRLFGVPPGRYIVSVGVDTKFTYARPNFGSNYYPLTYHPDAKDESSATVIEVTSGSEAAGIDITLGDASRAYRVSGRIVDADTGKPVAGLSYGYGTLQQDGRSFGSTTTNGANSNSRGEFQLDGIMPGHYAAYASTSDVTASEFYSDLASFEIIDADVPGLEIKVHRGSAITGIVVVEGEAPEDAPRLSNLRIDANVRSQSVSAPRFTPINVAPDGTFRATGLQPGKAFFYVAMYPMPKGLSLVRLERDGVEQPEGIEVSAGEQVTGVKLVLGYGTGVIRGQVKIEGGASLDGARMFINCRQIPNGQGRGAPTSSPDTRGRFTLDGLFAGDYEISLYITLSPAPGRPPFQKSVTQKVSIANGTETPVTFVINPNENKQP
jgi:hypothetical protein